MLLSRKGHQVDDISFKSPQFLTKIVDSRQKFSDVD